MVHTILQPTCFVTHFYIIGLLLLDNYLQTYWGLCPTKLAVCRDITSLITDESLKGLEANT